MRRQFLIEARYQYFYTITVTFGGVFVLLALGLLSSAVLYEAARTSGLQPAVAAGIRVQAYQQLILTALLMFPVVVAYALGGFYLSYRAAGPLRRLERWLEGYLRDGRCEPFSVRSKDAFAGMATRLASVFSSAPSGQKGEPS